MDPEQIAATIAKALAPMFDGLIAALEPPPADAPPPAPALDDEDGGDRVRMHRTIADLNARNQALEDARDALAVQATRLRYERAFDALEQEGVTFDRAREMDVLLTLPAPLRDGHLDRMREQYRRSPVGQRGLIRTAGPVDRSPPSEEEREAIRDYAIKHKLGIEAARERYRAEQADRV
jgi:hypothetical protein